MNKRKREDNYRERMSVTMKDGGSRDSDERPGELTISKSDNQIYQKLYLCDYLSELYEATEEENEHSSEKK